MPRTKATRSSEARTVTKRDLVERIALETGQTKVLVREIVQLFLDEVTKELERGRRLEFRNFGIFEVRARPSRVAQNPKTLEKVTVPARRVVRFKAGDVLRRRVERSAAHGAGSGARGSAGHGA